MCIPIVCIALLWQAPVMPADSSSPGIYDVIIHEIMPKPSPVTGLPPYEYIELRNNSSRPVQLQNWRLAVNKRETTLPACWLQPDSLLLLCSTEAAGNYSISNVLGIDRFPVLPDDTAQVVLYNEKRQVIHAIAYTPSWYGADSKVRAGYSLEMINPALPCSGKINWRMAAAREGGSPGRVNSVAAATTDGSRPDLYFAALPDSMQVVLHFSKTLDSAVAADPVRYQLNNGSIRSVTVIPPLFNMVALQLDAPIAPDQTYTLTTSGITDCQGNESGIKNTLSFAWPQLPDTAGLVINELLFYPPDGVPEFIEVYNRSNKAIDLQQVLIAARKADGRPGPLKRLAPYRRLLMPGQLLAITTVADQLCSHYNCKMPENIQEVSSLPQMPMDGGGLLLLRDDSLVIEELRYSAAFHFQLASQPKGVSLERLDDAQPASLAANWSSAAATAGYATPGYINSCQWPVPEAPVIITVTPPVFSPDNTGSDNRATLAYQLPDAGWVGNVTIFNADGRPVRYLARNLTLGNKGYLYWDGFGENTVVLPPGIYIFFIEIFNLRGQVKRWKHALVMARKLS